MKEIHAIITFSCIICPHRRRRLDGCFRNLTMYYRPNQQHSRHCWTSRSQTKSSTCTTFAPSDCASNNTFLCPRLPPLLIRNTLFYPHTRYWKTLELKFSLRSLAQTAFRNFETTLLLGHGRGMLNNTTVAEARARLDELVGVTKAVEEIEVRRVHAGAGESQGGQPSNAGQDDTAASQSNLPLDVQLAKTYGLSKQDHELFQLLALQMTARSNLFGSQMLEYADHTSTTVFTDLAKM